MIHRRLFVKNSLAASIFSVSGFTALSWINPKASNCKACSFHPLVGQSVAARFQGGQRIELTLMDVKECDLGSGPIPSDVRRDPFSCLWKLEGASVEEGMVEIDHPELGKIKAHLFPKWEEEGSGFYETIWG